MDALLEGLVPGCQTSCEERILERAEGVPLYAVETVRMLLDRGRSSSTARSIGRTATIEALEVPETLHALVAARLDALGGEERRVLQDGAVLGKTFTKRALSVLSGLPEPELEPLLAALDPQGGARRPVRPAVAGARSVRLPPGSAPPGLLRDPRESRPQGKAPGGRRVPRGGLG